MSYLDEFIRHRAYAYLFRMAQAGHPVGIWMYQMELVLATKIAVMMAAQHVVRVEDGSLHHQVSTSHVQCNRVGRGQHAQVGYNGGIIVIPAIAFGRHVHYEADVEVRFVLQHGLRIFGNFIIEVLGGVPVAYDRRIVLTEGHTLPAADTFGVINFRFTFSIEVYGIMGTMFHTDVAADAVSLL